MALLGERGDAMSGNKRRSRSEALTKSRLPALAADPFVGRIRTMLYAWVETEWATRECIQATVRVSGWTNQLRAEHDAALLTVENLAQRLENISLSKLRRELRKLGAPTPGDLIREARIAYAERLLVGTRLLVREVASRAGYDSERQFKTIFQKATGTTPSTYRKSHIAAISAGDGVEISIPKESS